MCECVKVVIETRRVAMDCSKSQCADVKIGGEAPTASINDGKCTMEHFRSLSKTQSARV